MQEKQETMTVNKTTDTCSQQEIRFLGCQHNVRHINIQEGKVDAKLQQHQTTEHILLDQKKGLESLSLHGGINRMPKSVSRTFSC